MATAAASAAGPAGPATGPTMATTATPATGPTGATTATGATGNVASLSLWRRILSSLSPKRRENGTPSPRRLGESLKLYVERLKISTTSPFKSLEARIRENLDEDGEKKLEVIARGLSRYERTKGPQKHRSGLVDPELVDMYQLTRKALIEGNIISEDYGAPEFGADFFGTKVTSGNRWGMAWPASCKPRTMAKRLMVVLKAQPALVAMPSAGPARTLDFGDNDADDTESTLVIATDDDVRASEVRLKIESETQFEDVDRQRVKELFGDDCMQKLRASVYFYTSWLFERSQPTNMTSRMRSMFASVRAGTLTLAPLVCVSAPPIALLGEATEFRPALDEETGEPLVSYNERRLGFVMPIDLLVSHSIVDVARAFGVLPGDDFDYNESNAFKSCLCQTAAFGALVGALTSTELSEGARAERIVDAARYLLNARVSWVHKVPVAGRVSVEYVNFAISEYVDTNRGTQLVDATHVGRNARVVELLKSAVLYIGDPTDVHRDAPALEIAEEHKGGDSLDAVVVNHSSGLSHVLVYVPRDALKEENRDWIERNMQPESVRAWRENGGRILTLFAMRAEAVDPNVEDGQRRHYSLLHQLALCDPKTVALDSLEKLATEAVTYTWNATDGAIASQTGFGEPKAKIFSESRRGVNSSDAVAIESSMHDFLWRAFVLKDFHDVAFTQEELDTLEHDERKMLVDELHVTSWESIIELVQTCGLDEADIDDDFKESMRLRIKSVLACNRWPTIKFAQLLALTFGVKIGVNDINTLTDDHATELGIANAPPLTIASVLRIAKAYGDRASPHFVGSNLSLKARLGERYDEWCERAKSEDDGVRLVALLDATEDENDTSRRRAFSKRFRRVLNVETCSRAWASAGQFALKLLALPRIRPSRNALSATMHIDQELFSNTSRVNTVVSLACSLAFYNKKVSVGARPRAGLSAHPLERDVHDFICDVVYREREDLRSKFEQRMNTFFTKSRE